MSYNFSENHKIRLSVSENPNVEVPSSYLQKCGISNFLPEDRSRMPVYLFVFAFFLFFVFFFLPGVIVLVQCSCNVTIWLILTEIKSVVPFLSDQKMEGTWASSHTHFSPNFTKSNFEIAILVTIIENPNNCVFGVDLLLRSPLGRGCKLQTLTSIYIQ